MADPPRPDFGARRIEVGGAATLRESAYEAGASEALRIGVVRAAPGGDTQLRRNPVWLYPVAALLFLVYAAWMLGPYLQSIIVRDAAVTTWSYVATAPIAGRLTDMPIEVGRRIDGTGLITTIRNPLLGREAVVEAEIRVRRAQSRLERAEEYLTEIKLLDASRADLKSHYAEVFRRQIDADLARLNKEIALAKARLATMQKIATRSEELERRGTGTTAARDETALRVAELGLEINEAEAALDYANVRRTAAGQGVFIDVDGDDPDWARGSRLELKIEKERAHQARHEAETELEFAQAALTVARSDLELRSQAAVTAPEGSIIWSQPTSPGTTVEAGAPVVEWLDCHRVLVDVPVSDAEVSLLRPGMTASVVLEGERDARVATVLLTRGSASVLGRDSLAALAKGRGPGVAQALLELRAGRPLDGECPVGQAAHVDFPGVGLFDVLRARLRL